MPYELLNKKFRAAQKSIDRDIASVSSSTRELNAQTERGEDMAVEEVVKTLDVVSQKLASLKRRVRQCVAVMLGLHCLGNRFLVTVSAQS